MSPRSIYERQERDVRLRDRMSEDPDWLQEYQNRAHAPSTTDLATDFSFEDPNDPGLLMGESAGAQAQADPRAVTAQQTALERLGFETDLAGRGILTPQQRALYGHTQDLAAQQAGAGRAAMLQQAEARGQGGTDLQMMSAQAGQQQGAQQRSQSDAQMQQALAQRAQQMRAAYSSLSRGARQESFDESMSRGQAQDDMNWFNTDWQREAEGRNVERRHGESQDEAQAQQQWWGNYSDRYAADDDARAHRVRRQYDQNNQERQRMTDVYQELLDTAGGIAGGGFGTSGSGGEGSFGSASRRRRS